MSATAGSPTHRNLRPGMPLLLLICVLVLLPGAVMAQSDVSDEFAGIGSWQVAAGDWVVNGGRLFQRSTAERLARIDRALPHSGEQEIELVFRYEEGGYGDLQALANGEFRAGFGLHVGTLRPALGQRSWGNGESLLLWLNLDTLPETRERFPEHFGLRAQLYHSRGSTNMQLLRDSAFSSVYGDARASVDIAAALGAETQALLTAIAQGGFLSRDLTVRIRLNSQTGRLMVEDPSLPGTWYVATVDPELLSGSYLSIRTSGLAISVDRISVRPVD